MQMGSGIAGTDLHDGADGGKKDLELLMLQMEGPSGKEGGSVGNRKGKTGVLQAT